MPNIDPRLARRRLPPLLAGILGLSNAAGVDALRHQHLRGGPELGDLIAFPARAAPDTATPTLSVSRDDGTSCVLDVATIQREGGSLVVVRRDISHSLILRVQWVGRRSAPGADDCGASTNLLLNKAEMTALLFAAGGYWPRGVRAP